jgi:WD repeat-containing protein 35
LKPHFQVECFYTLEEYGSLEKLTATVPDGHPILRNIGHKLASVGLCVPAVAALLKAGDVKAAVDCCVLLNQWDQVSTATAMQQVANRDSIP